MHANNLEQLICFGFFIATGVIIGIIFDIFRIWRKAIHTSDVVTNIQDILFCFITGIILAISIFYFNNGELRLFIFIGIIIGVTFYMVLISKYFIEVSVNIVNFIKKFLHLVIQPFIMLINFTKKLIFRPISFIIINVKYFTIKNLQKKIKRLHNKKEI